jgi:glucose-6-phosphate-specific signal transduction histidine kinase
VAKRIALGFLLAASPMLGLAFLIGGRAPVAWVAALVVLSPVALLAVGISRRDRALGGAGRYLVALALVLVASALGALFSSPAPVLVGLPAGALWLLGGLWIAPLLLLGWAYPRTFSRAVLDRSDLHHLERRQR